MKLYINLFKSIILFASFLIPMISWGVTKEEMEEARTIAAKAYLRYANDGSGYLDDVNAKTIEQLESLLKNKEKENIKAFKAIPVPNDYADWNREKLVEYWAVTAFQNKGLLEKGRGGRIRARSQINKMALSDNKAQTPATSPSEEKKQAGAAEAKSDSTATSDNAQNALNELDNTTPSAINQEILEDSEAGVEKAANYTWVYIMVLAILVAIVVALVVYASNVMKKNANKRLDPDLSEANNAALAEELDKYKEMVADKDVDISMLSKKLDMAQKQNEDLKSQIARLSSEIATLKTAAKSSQQDHSRYAPQSENPSGIKGRLRTIFLGRANAKGVFVRADRNLNVGNSIFLLETNDGYTGSFKVADSQAAWSLALSNPREYLENACTGHDLDYTANVSRIITESSGTAVFEGGCWRVIRKAKIRYER